MRMKTKMILFTVIVIALCMIEITGYDKDENDKISYSGTIVPLGSENNCFDIIRIDDTLQGGLQQEL